MSGLMMSLREDVRPRLVADLERVAETLVMSSSVRSPLRSSSALVATVVPIFTAPICPAGIGSPGARPSSVADALHRRVAIGFRIFGQKFVRDEACRPACAPTTSVNVPPRSIQKSQLASLYRWFFGHASPLRHAGLCQQSNTSAFIRSNREIAIKRDQ